MRTKNGLENSYNAPDSINRMDWHRRSEMKQAVDYMKGLIALRKHEPLFRLRTIDEVKEHMNILKADYQIVVYQLEDTDKLYYVIFNGQTNPIDFDVEAGDYRILIEDGRAYLDEPRMVEALSRIRVETLSVTVLMKNK